MNTSAPTPNAPATVVTVDATAIYTLLLEVRDTAIAVKHDTTDLKEDSKDHEQRIRSLEKSRWAIGAVALTGGAGLSQAIGALIGS